MTSIASVELFNSKSKKFIINIPVKYELAEFLSKSLPDPMICEFLGIDVSAKYTLFNLYTLLQKHLAKRGTAAYYTVSDKMREVLSLPNEREMSKAKITHHLMKYLKDNGLQNDVWFYFDLDDTLLELFNITKTTEQFNIFDFTESSQFKSHLSDNCIYFDIYGLSNELAEFLDLSEHTEMNNVAVVQRILEYIKEKRLQDPKNGITILPDKKLKDLLCIHN